jgi:hypothetical protein
VEGMEEGIPCAKGKLREVRFDVAAGLNQF